MIDEPNFKAIFEKAPDCYLILAPDKDFTIVAVTNAYLEATMTERENIVGRPLFKVFPDNPADPAATGVRNLRASLNYVKKYLMPHSMLVQKYDIPRPDSHLFEERFWAPTNWPIIGPRRTLRYILHRVEDITELARFHRFSERPEWGKNNR